MFDTLIRKGRKLLTAIFWPKGVAPNETVSVPHLIRKDSGNFGRGVSSRAKTLGERRDALLLGAGALYLLGYLSWATYGLINQIGFIPVLDTQYFAAGVLPAVLLFAFIWVIRSVRVFDMWMRYPPTRSHLLVSRLLLVAAVGGFVWLQVAVKGNPGVMRSSGFRSSFFWFTTSTSACLYFSAVFARNRGFRPMQLVVVYTAHAYAILGLFLWVLYVKQLMPKLPPEWGGARSRCVLVDIDSEQLSLETRPRILADTIGTG